MLDGNGGRDMRRILVLLAAIATAVAIAGCGGGGSSSSSSTESSPSTETSAETSGETSGGAEAPGSVAESKELAEAAFTVPTKIPVTQELKEKPPKRVAAFIEPQIPAGKSQTAGFEEAAKAIGWELKIYPADPFKPAGAIQQAIDAGVDYIFITGAPVALFPEQMEAAHKAGIPILECFGTDEPSPKGLFAECGGEESEEGNGELLADWAIGDSDGKANILAVNVPDYPILVAQEKAFKSRLAQKCPECTIESLGVTVEDLAEGKVPQAVASKLQSNPDINYIYFTFSDLPTGVYETLAGAGLNEGVTLFELDFNQERLQEIEEGKIKVAGGLPKAYSAWLLFHFAALNAEGTQIEGQKQASNLPRILVGKEEASKYMTTRFQWPGPEGFQKQFEALWHLGS